MVSIVEAVASAKNSTCPLLLKFQPNASTIAISSDASDCSFSPASGSLASLHRTELVFAQELRKGDELGAKVTIKSILRIKEFEIDKVPRNFDLDNAADYTYEAADAYTISLVDNREMSGVLSF